MTINQPIRVCGMMFCYNEAQIIGDSVRYYLQQGLDLVVFDNVSTDNSLEIIENIYQSQGGFPGKIVELQKLETNGYEWKKILKAAQDYMHLHLVDYDWLVLIDADSFYHSPVQDSSLLDFINRVHDTGYNIIDGELYEFYPTEKSDLTIKQIPQRLQYYETGSGNRNQHKIFRYHPSIDFVSRNGHVCKRDGAVVLTSPKFIYKHYPWVSLEHGVKKIFQERMPRYIERKENPGLHQQYLGMLPIQEDLIQDSKCLTKYIAADVELATFPQLPPISDCLKSESQQSLPTRKFERVLENPRVYHFLVNNFCNARCSFCNQSEAVGYRQQLSIDKFQAMLKNIPVKDAKVFYLTGGGEPLLCSDFFVIARYINKELPWITLRVRTNGLLIKKFAAELASLAIQIEISLHGDEEINDQLLQVRTSYKIFEGLEELKRLRDQSGRELDTSFHCALSRQNISMVETLIQKAADYGVSQVWVQFCRFYGGRDDASVRMAVSDSLYYHQELYNKHIRQAVVLARDLGVDFHHAPLFGESFERTSCKQPWKLMLVDWEGKVYPCCGGEERFKGPVERGEYSFGNLLKESAVLAWTNPDYTKLRRTCSPEGNENFIPECTNCHQAVRFIGPDHLEAHLIEPCENEPPVTLEIKQNEEKLYSVNADF